MQPAVTWFVAIALLGCGGKKEEPPAPATGSAPVVGTKAPAAAAGLEIFVGESNVASADVAKVAAWPRLDGLLPENARRLGTWKAIQTTNASGKTSTLEKPFAQYRDFVPALFPGEGGDIAFGLFDPVELGKRGKPALRDDHLTKLVVVLDESSTRGGNDHGSDEVVDPANVKLEIVTAQGTTTLSGEKLLGIEREPMPGGGGDAKGWQVPAILTAAGVDNYTKLTLTSDDGASVPLTKAELGPDSVPFVKLNRKGQMRFRLYKKQGSGFTSGADLRSLVKIKVE